MQTKKRSAVIIGMVLILLIALTACMPAIQSETSFTGEVVEIYPNGMMVLCNGGGGFGEGEKVYVACENIPGAVAANDSVTVYYDGTVFDISPIHVVAKRVESV